MEIPALMQGKCKVNESRITLNREGMAAKIEIDAIPGMKLTGRVIKVNRYAEPGSYFSSSIKEYATIIESLDPAQLPVTATVDDGDELRIGAEYVFVKTTPIVAVRGGVWFDPDHRLRATEDANVVVTALRPPGEDEVHVAAGVGLVFKKMQLDLGADLSERVDTVSLSLIFKF